jgi:hypothetical protein
MLRIGEAQVRQFTELIQRDFVSMMTSYLRDNFPNWMEPLSDEELRSWVELGLAAAERYEISHEPEVAQVILLFLVLGVDAGEATPWVSSILTNPDLAAAGKVRKLITTARSQRIEGIEHVIMYNDMEAEWRI